MSATARQDQSPVARKTFHAALVVQLRQHVPTLGELTAGALATRLEQVIEEFFPAGERLRMGQLLWLAVEQTDRPRAGKRIEDTRLKPVVLNLLTSEDLQARDSGVGRPQIRKWVVVRLFKEAMRQGGVLSSDDVAAILRIDRTLVNRCIKEHERETGEVVPRRATVHDMGPTITHKAIICRKVIVDGRSIEEAARETQHSPEAVSRYVLDYRRVLACLKQGLNVQQSAYATGMSVALVREYQKLGEQFGDPDEP
jgi:hypothetical protein